MWEWVGRVWGPRSLPAVEASRPVNRDPTRGLASQYRVRSASVRPSHHRGELSVETNVERCAYA
jgi:hypothetical protein